MVLFFPIFNIWRIIFLKNTFHQIFHLKNCKILGEKSIKFPHFYTLFNQGSHNINRFFLKNICITWENLLMDDHQNGNLTKLKKEKKRNSNNNIKSLLTIPICFSNSSFIGSICAFKHSHLVEPEVEGQKLPHSMF